MRAVSDELIVTTDDGSYGRKTLVTVPLKEILEAQPGQIVKIWAIGPAIMMKFVSATTKPSTCIRLSVLIPSWWTVRGCAEAAGC